MLFISVSASTAALAPTAHVASRHSEAQEFENHMLERDDQKVDQKRLEEEQNKRKEVKMTEL